MGNALLIMLAALVIGVLLYLLANNTITSILSSFNLGSLPFLGSNNTNSGNTHSNYSITSGLAQNQIINYTLQLINRDRQQYGLSNVTLATTNSGQQHADSMLAYRYFSHWDPYGMKPYVRYTLLGGTEGITENDAYLFSYLATKSCNLFGCTTTVNGINVTNSIQKMEYGMMYNDSACCNNGHRENILDAHHNQVSIGVSYNNTKVYLVEDFVDNYIVWSSGSPYVSNSFVALKGGLLSGYQIYAVEVGYEPLPANMTNAQLNSTFAYSYGQPVAGVSYGSYYYNNLVNLPASRYSTSGSNFDVEFDMSKLVSQYKAGAYTVIIWLSYNRSNFLAASYTVFINNNGVQFVPQNI